MAFKNQLTNQQISLKSRTEERQRKLLDLYFKSKHGSKTCGFTVRCIWFILIYPSSSFTYNPIKITGDFWDSVVLRTKLCPQLPLCNNI